MEFWGKGGVAHFGISEGKGGLKHGSRLWLGMDIFWNCPLAVPINFIRGIWARKLDCFRLDLVSKSDEHASIISDYL